MRRGFRLPSMLLCSAFILLVVQAVVSRGPSAQLEGRSAGPSLVRPALNFAISPPVPDDPFNPPISRRLPSVETELVVYPIETVRTATLGLRSEGIDAAVQRTLPA